VEVRGRGGPRLGRRRVGRRLEPLLERRGLRDHRDPLRRQVPVSRPRVGPAGRPRPPAHEPHRRPGCRSSWSTPTPSSTAPRSTRSRSTSRPACTSSPSSSPTTITTSPTWPTATCWSTGSASRARRTSCSGENEQRTRIMICDPWSTARPAAAARSSRPSPTGPGAGRRATPRSTELFAFITDAKAAGEDFEAGLRVALQAALVSPLLRVPRRARPGTHRPHAAPAHRPRARLAALVLPVEQHARRGAARWPPTRACCRTRAGRGPGPSACSRTRAPPR
jgi:hypothetical protein